LAALGFASARSVLAGLGALASVFDSDFGSVSRSDFGSDLAVVARCSGAGFAALGFASACSVLAGLVAAGFVVLASDFASDFDSVLVDLSLALSLAALSLAVVSFVALSRFVVRAAALRGAVAPRAATTPVLNSPGLAVAATDGRP
jgi:hypothetical protein